MEVKEGWRWATVVVSILIFVVLIVLDFTGHLHRGTDFDHYDVGDCLNGSDKGLIIDAPFAKIEKVDCSDPKANYQILKRIPGDEESCEGTPRLVATYTKTIGGDRLYTLCLGNWGTT
jgi:hypothetical protein